MCDERGELAVVRRDDQLDAELVGLRPASLVARVVDGDDVGAARRSSARTVAAPATANPYTSIMGRSSDEMRVKSPMNRPRAAATHAAAISQKRMITVVSGQPTSSKWWWIGDMRNSRCLRPLRLEHAHLQGDRTRPPSR